MNKSEATPLTNALKAARPAIATAVVFSLFINVLALVSPLYMLQVYDRVLTSRNVSTLLALTLIVVFLLLVYAALEFCRTQVLVRGGVRFERALQEPLFSTVLRAQLRHGVSNDAQSFREVDSVREFITGAGLVAFCDVPWIPVFVAVSFLLHPWFGYLAIGGGLVIFTLAVVNEILTRETMNGASRASIAAQRDASATLRNAEVMKAMGMWRGLMHRWRDRREEFVGYQAVASDRSGGVMAMIRFCRAILQTAILGVGAYLVIQGSLSAGAMIAASILVGRAVSPIESAVGQWKGFLNARGAWTRLNVMFRAGASEINHMSLPPPVGRVTAEHIVVAPPGSRDPTIRGISFDLKPGTALAIIGPSASGKSSLARALVNVWPTVAGSVRLDGFDLKQWDAEELGRHVGYLPQDIELFSGTVAENISRFTSVDAEEAVRAARFAGVHELIQQLPNGYDTQIGEGGVALSGGQRQRIGLARALYNRPTFIVLDEPNASLDAHGEAALMESIQRIKAAKLTLVFITHRTNLLGLADQILMLNGGALQMLGDRDEILSKLLNAPKANASAVKVAG